jgi:hypothetical protein
MPRKKKDLELDLAFDEKQNDEIDLADFDDEDEDLNDDESLEEEGEEESQEADDDDDSSAFFAPEQDEQESEKPKAQKKPVSKPPKKTYPQIPQDAIPPPIVVQVPTKEKRKRERSSSSSEREQIRKNEEIKARFLAQMGLTEFEAHNFKVHIERLKPETWYDAETGETLFLAGYLGESTDPVDSEYLRERYGSGTYKLRVWGPNKKGGSSLLTEKKITVSAGVPNLIHLPQEDPMTRRENEQRARQGRRGRPMQQQGPDINERIITATTDILEGQVSNSRDREEKLLQRLDEKEGLHKQEVEGLRRQIEKMAESHRNQKQEMDPIYKQLANKVLSGTSEPEKQPTMLEIMQVAKEMQPDFSALTQSMQAMTESVKQQLVASQTMMAHQFESTTKMLTKQMEMQNASFNERMELQRQQAEFLLKQTEQKGDPVDPKKELKDTLGLLTTVLEFKKELAGEDEGGGSDKDDASVGSETPFWAKMLSDTFGKALFSIGPAVGSMMGVPEGVIREQIRNSHKILGGEQQPADMSEEELEEYAPPTQQIQAPPMQEAPPMHEEEDDILEAKDVKLMSLVAMIEEAIAEKQTPKATASEIYPLLRSFIKQEPMILAADPVFIWTTMKGYTSDGSPLADDNGRLFCVETIDVVKKLYDQELKEQFENNEGDGDVADSV